MSEVDGCDGLVDGVSDDHTRAARSVRVVEDVAVVVEASSDLVVIGWRCPDEPCLRRGRACACTARRVPDADGALHIDEFAVGDVDRGSSVDDEFRTLSHFDIALKVHGTRPCLGASDGPLRRFVHGHGAWNGDHGQHERQHVEHDQRYGFCAVSLRHWRFTCFVHERHEYNTAPHLPNLKYHL